VTNSNILKGSLLALLAFFFMAIFGILTKIALEEASIIWISFLAYLAGTCTLSVFILPKGLAYLKSTHYPYLFGRALFGTAASFFYTISLHYIPIVNGTLLFNTAPIFIPLLAVLFLHTKIQKAIWYAVALGFVGIIVIIQPTEAIFTQTGNLIALCSGIALAIAYLLMKLLTSSDPGDRIIFYYLGIGTLCQLPLLYFGGDAPHLSGCLWALLSGIFLLGAQIALVNAYHYASASEVGVYQYTSVIFVGILEWLIWNTVPNSWDLLGVLLVMIAGVIIIRYGTLNHDQST